MEANIVVLAGDGIGPEVTTEASRVLDTIAAKYGHIFHYTEHLMGGCSIDQYGTALTDATLEACQQSDAVLLGAVGGPKWDNPNAAVRPEQGLLRLRKGLGVFANLRPVKVHPDLISASPLKEDRLNGVDLLVVRELTGGLYFGTPKERGVREGVEYGVDTLEYKDFEVERVVDLAFRLAQNRRQKVVSVDKANVLESSRLWRQVTTKVRAKYPGVSLENVLVDTAAMRLISNPASFDVVVTENMFGDILTDEASVLSGSMGMLPSASLGESGPGLYEPIHGSAPDIAGKGIANPLGAILSVALMLRYTFSLDSEASAIETAVDRVISNGYRTKDLGGNLGTTAIADQVIAAIG